MATKTKKKTTKRKYKGGSAVIVYCVDLDENNNPIKFNGIRLYSDRTICYNAEVKGIEANVETKRGTKIKEVSSWNFRTKLTPEKPFILNPTNGGKKFIGCTENAGNLSDVMVCVHNKGELTDASKGVRVYCSAKEAYETEGVFSLTLTEFKEQLVGLKELFCDSNNGLLDVALNLVNRTKYS